MSLFGLLGTAVGDIFGGLGAEKVAEGDQAAAADYRQASAIAGQNANLVQYSTQIQEAQNQRKVEQATGSVTAGYAAGGVAGGTEGDVLRSSVQQGALAGSVIAVQGGIQRNAFEQQAEAYQAMASQADAAAAAAKLSATGQFIGAGIAGAGALFSLF